MLECHLRNGFNPFQKQKGFKMKRVVKKQNEVLAVQILTVTLESLKNDLVALKDSVNISENLGGAFVLNSINANLSNEDLKSLFEECKKVLSVSYAKKVCGAINIPYKTPLSNEQKELLKGKGFNVMYEQLRAFKTGAGAVVDSVQSVKVKAEKISQKRNDVNEAKKSKENHLENAIVKSASLADVYDLLTSLGEMATAQKDNSKVLNFLATALLNIENETYDLTA